MSMCLAGTATIQGEESVAQEAEEEAGQLAARQGGGGDTARATRQV